MFGKIGATEVIFAVAMIFLLFGTKRLPMIARGIGEGIRNFKSGIKEPDRIEGKSSAEDATARNGDSRV